MGCRCERLFAACPFALALRRFPPLSGVPGGRPLCCRTPAAPTSVYPFQLEVPSPDVLGVGWDPPLLPLPFLLPKGSPRIPGIPIPRMPRP